MPGSVTLTYNYMGLRAKNGAMNSVTAAWEADSGGAVSGVTPISISGVIRRIVTDPDSDAPTSSYDITLVDDNGLDVALGLLGNRHTSTTEQVIPALGDTSLTLHQIAVVGELDLVVANAGDANNGVVKIYWS